MANNLERAERLEVERDYYRSLPAQQFQDLVEEEIPRIWREDSLVIEHDLQDAYWQSSQSIVSRLRHLAQERIKAQWTEQGIWKDPWDRKLGEHYKVEGGWPHRLDDGTGDRVGTPQRSPTRIPWRSARKRRDEFERCRAVMEDASRPFRMFLEQLLRARERLGAQGGAAPDALSSHAYDEVKAAWVRRRIWLASWDPLPGMTWGHEKPLREFVAETRPWLSLLCVEGRAQRWAEELVGTKESGTWERDADVRGLVWTIPSQKSDERMEDEGVQQRSAMSEMIPALLGLKQPPDPPGLFGKPEDLATAPKLKIVKPTRPSWGLVKIPQDKKGQLKKLDFRVFDFPWDMPLSQTYYRDNRFKKAVARRLRRDFDSVADAEDFYEMEHLKATQGAEREYRLNAEAEDQLARRHEAYRRWEHDYVKELKRYQAQFKKIDWKDFKLPDDAALGTEIWADARFRAEIMRRVPGLAADAYLDEHRRCKSQLLVPVSEAWTIDVEEEDSLQRRWQAQKKRAQPKKRKRAPQVN
ncbi:hypothetical protein PFICI_08550 [Pestalotiopsis fici W106-1]|uniref:Uncharacterized protein n=1 Tax=Pestalotiopsis fici (strain W106-1 / CGMCC3.15140) TaxID=1229662 RepID=W3WZZ1_PESFW|nr:uncharacterized protein PFICI_08550 [Pestalotiopsis fici W106-1]ETS78697.1 hypothetical protein PFICI_08550 [Pestalotiopsis fici W106-1]